MMYYYSTVDEIVLTHSEIKKEEYQNVVVVHFERPSEKGFDFAVGKIPHFKFHKTYGFSEDELMKFQEYMKLNSALIWDFAAKGGGENT